MYSAHNFSAINSWWLVINGLAVLSSRFTCSHWAENCAYKYIILSTWSRRHESNIMSSVLDMLNQPNMWYRITRNILRIKFDNLRIFSHKQRLSRCLWMTFILFVVFSKPLVVFNYKQRISCCKLLTNLHDLYYKCKICYWPYVSNQ